MFMAVMGIIKFGNDVVWVFIGYGEEEGVVVCKYIFRLMVIILSYLYYVFMYSCFNLMFIMVFVVYVNEWAKSQE